MTDPFTFVFAVLSRQSAGLYTSGLCTESLKVLAADFVKACLVFFWTLPRDHNVEKESIEQ